MRDFRMKRQGQPEHGNPFAPQSPANVGKGLPYAGQL
jgi:hypothetical protein